MSTVIDDFDREVQALLAASPLNPERIDVLIEDLIHQGFSHQRDFFSSALIDALLSDLERLEAHDALTSAGIGRLQEHQLASSVRGDAIRWLNRESPAQQVYLQRLDELREEINRALFIGLFEFEAHFARYPPGAFYKRHVDSFQGRANRVISTVTYLNRDWPIDGGGEMVLFESQQQGPDGFDPHAPIREMTRVHPEAGTLACFLSDAVPHEVLPTRLPRASIAGWFRRNASVNGVVDPAR
ncbi:2OG-Fe(II) oxygenase [Kushneria marisflavi]|uniref:2OG-Fe(II) oxygenase n=1 Tax=Kushneria marisflavi TaxID=157779 RepID=A0A240UR06_9GAMM|nr:2OG-Fe(II) oxygenase [Kushneria marisflavi]ART63921.1 2OG-Fe(II) oxygenase [Kushneria marisflavi]RKD85637.1 SM-20-related protein [Kushneria marisflavi]